MIEARPYDTKALDERVTDLKVIAIDATELEQLLIQFPRQTRGVHDIKAQMDELGEEFWAVRLSWRGRLRGPLGMSINGLVVIVAMLYGHLLAEDKTSPTGVQRIGFYRRLLDDDFGKIHQQDMLIFGSIPKAPSVQSQIR